MKDSRFSQPARAAFAAMVRDRAHSLRVVIADDHRRYRQGLARLLRANGIDVVAECANGAAVLRAVEETAPDVVLVDLNMPGISGREVTRRLTAHAPVHRVLVLSVSALQDDITDAILAGASGYVLKDRPVEEIVAAIRAAAGATPVRTPNADILCNLGVGEALHAAGAARGRLA